MSYYDYQKRLVKTNKFQSIIDKDINAIYNSKHMPKPYSYIYVNDNDNDNDNGWRCYIFGKICGLIIDMGIKDTISMTIIKNENGYWYIDEYPMDTYDVLWIDDKIKVYQTAKKWLKKNCNIIYYPGHEGESDWICGYTHPKN